MGIFSKRMGIGYVVSPIAYSYPHIITLRPKQEGDFTYLEFEEYGKILRLGWLAEFDSCIPFNFGIIPELKFKVEEEVSRPDLIEPAINRYKGAVKFTVYRVSAWLSKIEVKKMERDTLMASNLLYERNQDIKEILGVKEHYQYSYEDPDILILMEDKAERLKIYLRSITKDWQFCIWVLEGTARQYHHSTLINLAATDSVAER